MENLLAKLRSKPRRQRQYVSLALAFLLTLGIFFLWYWNFHVPAAPAAPVADSSAETASSSDFSASN